MFLRRLILVVFLLVAQVAASAHALEHLSGHQDGHAPGETCHLCLAAHDLNTALAASVPPLAVPPAQHERAILPVRAGIAVAAPVACQRGPPAA